MARSTTRAPAKRESSAKAKAKPASPKADRQAPAAKAPAAKAPSTGGRTRKRPWLASYPSVVPAEIGPLTEKSLGDLVQRACRRYAGRPAFSSMGKTMTFAQIDAASTAFAGYLQGRGLSKGDRIAIMMPNVLQYPIAMIGALKAGLVVVNVNPLYTARELQHQLKDSGAAAIVILENFAHTLEKIASGVPVKHVVVAAMGDQLGTLKGALVNFVVRHIRKMVPAWSLPGHVRFASALAEGRTFGFRPPEIGPGDIAFLQYTGGTTGVSKGAVLTHSNLLANLAQSLAWIESAYVKRPKPQRLTFLCALPLYHVYALTVNALCGIQQGGHNVLVVNPRDIKALVKDFARYPINIFPGLNTLFNALLNNAEFQRLDFKNLLLTFGGGMAVQKPVAERWQKLTGCIVSEGYGLSETSPVATANPFDAEEFSGTIGLPISSTEVAIRDEDGADLPLGEVGEICIRGPQVMAGYWNQPEETAKVMTEDGFFRSGDMGFMDERGYVKIVDRKKDMILVSGFNVYPNELEEVMAAHPGVLEVAAVGVPDEHSGEVPKLYVVRKDPSLTAEEVLDYARKNLTGYKRPKQVEFRDSLPKSNVGKILRRELRG